MQGKHKTQPVIVLDSIPGCDEVREEDLNYDDNTSDNTHTLSDESISSLSAASPVTAVPSTSASTIVPDRFSSAKRTIKEKIPSPYDRLEACGEGMHNENMAARKAMQEHLVEQNELIRQQNDQRERFLNLFEKFINK